MYSGLGKSKSFGSNSNRRSGLNHVHSQFAGSLFDGVCHTFPSDAVSYRNYLMRQIDAICVLDSMPFPL